MLFKLINEKIFLNKHIYWLLFLITLALVSTFFVNKYNVDHLVFVEIAKNKNLSQIFGPGQSQYGVHFSPMLYLTYIVSTDFGLTLYKSLIVVLTLIMLFFSFLIVGCLF